MAVFTPVELRIEPFEDGRTYSVPAVQSLWSACKTVFGVRFCVSIKVHINGVHMCVSVAGFEQCFGIGGNGCFDFEMGVARVGVCISDFNYKNGHVCFEFKVRGCVGVKIPFDGTVQKCKTLFEEDVCVPIPTLEAVEGEGLSEEEQLSKLQILSTLLDQS
jgi:hypothetical protein